MDIGEGNALAPAIKVLGWTTHSWVEVGSIRVRQAEQLQIINSLSYCGKARKKVVVPQMHSCKPVKSDCAKHHLESITVVPQYFFQFLDLRSYQYAPVPHEVQKGRGVVILNDVGASC